MATDRWLEFHDSRVLAVACTADLVSIDLDAYVHQWEGHGPSRRGTGWMQIVRIEVQQPVVEQLIHALPATLWEGQAISDDEGGLLLPTTVNGPVVVDLHACSGERLRISGVGLRAVKVAEPRFVEDLQRDMDPERTTS